MLVISANHIGNSSSNKFLQHRIKSDSYVYNQKDKAEIISHFSLQDDVFANQTTWANVP